MVYVITTNLLVTNYCFPFIPPSFKLRRVMKEVLRIEKAVDRCMVRLNERKRFPDDWDEIESITSMTQSTRSRPYASSARRETELLKEKILALELENMDLRKRFLSHEKKESAPSSSTK